MNGKHYLDYEHRLPLLNADYVSFKGDVEIKSVRFGAGHLEDFLKPVVSKESQEKFLVGLPI